MSILGKYRKEAEKESQDSREPPKAQPPEPTVQRTTTSRTRSVRTSAIAESVPNKERKSPIVSFSVTSDLRACLQAIRRSKAINLSMWVDKQLRDAIADEFPDMAKEYLGI